MSLFALVKSRGRIGIPMNLRDRSLLYPMTIFLRVGGGQCGLDSFGNGANGEVGVGGLDWH